MNRGGSNPRATVDDETALRIKRMHANGASYREIADRIGISYQQVYQIINYTWKHIQLV